MKISRRAFSVKYNFEIQWLTELCEKNYIPYEIKSGKRNSIFLNDNVINTLKEDEHYVICPQCLKKMACITEKHLCKTNEPKYCKIYLENHKKTEEQKIKQSIKLKKRFLTPEGEITRKLIGEASKKINSSKEFIERKKIISKIVNNRPEIKMIRKKKSLEMWSDPSFRQKMSEYVDNNIESLRESAKRARQFLTKTSKLHIGYKEKMLEKGLVGFISEYSYGPYFIDEADPFAKIAVEVDGCYWHGCKTCSFKGDNRIKAIEKRKTSFLKNRGWIILKIKEHEIKKDPYVGIELIRNIQEKRRILHKEFLKKSFLNNSLKVRSMLNKQDDPVWLPINDVVRHHTPNKKMVEIKTEIGSVKVTEDHSLFDGNTKNPVLSSDIKPGDTITGIITDKFVPIPVVEKKDIPPEKFTYDLSVPQAENFVLDSGILAHNTYSISGVSLDIEKSSKYMSVKDEFINEYDKLVEAAKRSIKIVKGLRQFRYGIGITSALGPLSRPGIQSRRNMVEAGSVGTWS